MKIYVKDNNDCVRMYDGMSLDTITTLLTDLGLTGTVITEEDYIAALPVRN